MISLFKKIRLSLISANPRSRYAVYALGEIILVVLGILIALQINNWNEERQDRAKERFLISQLHQEFLNNKKDLQSTLSINCELLQSTDQILSFLVDRKKIQDPHILDSIFGDFYTGTATFNPSNGIVYSIANSESIDLVTNDSLKQAILGWRGVLEDYAEDEQEVKRFATQDLFPYILDQGGYTTKNLFDDRVDLSFLYTAKFESYLVHRRWGLALLCGAHEESIFQEVNKLQSAIDKMIELTQAHS